MKKRITSDTLPRVLTPRQQINILCRRDLAAVRCILTDCDDLPIEHRHELAKQVLGGLVAKIVWSERLSRDIKMPLLDGHE